MKNYNYNYTINHAHITHPGPEYKIVNFKVWEDGTHTFTILWKEDGKVYGLHYSTGAFGEGLWEGLSWGSGKQIAGTCDFKVTGTPATKRRQIRKHFDAV